MYRTNRVKNPYLKQIIANTVYVIIAALIVLCGIYALFKGEEGREFYPAVFILAAALNFTDGIPRILVSGRNTKKKAGGIALCLIGVVLTAVAAIIAYMVWR